MILYSCALNIGPGIDLETVTERLAAWCGRTLGKHGTTRWVDAPSLLEGATYSSGSARLRSAAAIDAFPRLLHILLNHPDTEVAGRLWTIELGVRQQALDESAIVTIIVDVEDSQATPLETPPPMVTRPKLVPDLLRRFSLNTSAPGTRVRQIQNSFLNTFQKEAESFERRYPILIVSPTSYGDYLVDPEALRNQVAGLADVWTIPPNADTWSMAESFPTIATWQGAVRVLWPRSHSVEYVPHKVFVERDLHLMSNEGSIDQQLLGQIMSRRMHQLHTSRHVTSSEVQREHVTRLVRQAGIDNAIDEETKALLDQQQDVIESLKRDLEAAEYLATEAEASAVEAIERRKEEERGRRDAEYDLRSIQTQLQELAAGRRVESGSSPEVLRHVIDKFAMDRQLSLFEALSIVAQLYPDQIRVLESAWKSAQDHSKFVDGTGAFKLLWKLATAYWESKINGEGDLTAQNIFGSAFAATESDTTASNQRAKAARTFTVDGTDTLMLAHLKIGTKGAQCWRCHFDWNPETTQIVIGWCGKHLDLR